MTNSNQNTDGVAQLKIAKVKCNNSTLFFTRYFFKKNHNKRFVIGDHHRLISEALDKVISGEIKRLIINIAPRYGKTELAVKNFIARGLAINPASKFIHLSYSDDLALDNSEAVKELVKHEAYKAFYSEVEIKHGSDSKKKWYTTKGGGVYATGAAGQVTGFGAGQVDDIDDEDFAETGKNKLFSGALIIDDPIKPEDADSEVIRERVNQRYDSTIKNRVNSRNTPIIIIMQRLHENDLCGYLIKQDPNEWTVLSLPCIKQDNTALWEFKHTLDELLKLKSDNETVFERQYQQDPKPLKGLLFPKHELSYYNPDSLYEDSFESSLGYTDVADEGSDSLASVIGRNIQDRVYITDLVFNKSNTDVTLPLIANKIREQEVLYMRVESNSMGAMFGRNLQQEVPNCSILLVNNSKNKHTRILMEAEFIKKYFRFLSEEFQNEEYRLFMKELCSYMKEVGTQKHDDAPDALSGLSLFIRGYLSHLYE